jgi:hypothetical protein
MAAAGADGVAASAPLPAAGAAGVTPSLAAIPSAPLSQLAGFITKSLNKKNNIVHVEGASMP